MPFPIPEDRIIAFIDILGFKNLVNHAEKTNNYQLICSTILNGISDFESLDRHADFQFTHFSDSFVLSLRSFDPNESMRFLIYLQDLINLFLAEKVLLRGGITVGKVIHTKKILLGPGMIRAYELESKFAKFPRVIIDTELIDFWEEQLYDLNFENVFELSKDKDGFYFMDYIAKSNFLSKKRLSAINEIACTLIDSSDKKLRQKGRWLKSKIAYGRKELKKQEAFFKEHPISEADLGKMF